MANNACQKVIDRLEAELNLLRTGRYPPAIVNGVVVEDILAMWHGVPTALKFFCLVEVDSATRRVTVRSFDLKAVDDVEKALCDAPMGVSVRRNGDLLQFDPPPLTSEEKAALRSDAERLVREAKVALPATVGHVPAKFVALADRLGDRFRSEIATAG